MLKVSANGRFLVHENGRPFFYLADTAWQLLGRLNREEADRYLEDRAEKKFTVIQAVLLFCSPDNPNAYGDSPYAPGDVTAWNEKYFEHADYIIRKANSLGLYVGLLPVWGNVVGKIWAGAKRNLIEEDNARKLGMMIGRRYASDDIIWILGGDHSAYGREHIWREMSAGIEEGDRRRGLMTYHPDSQWNSCAWFHNDPWLDFNMFQSGHTLYRDNWRDTALCYAMNPPRPCMDGEPGYEEIPHDFNIANGYLNDYQVRLFAYSSLFAGAFGYTYGHNSVFQFFQPPRESLLGARVPWKKALDAPGARQMTHVRALMESRPFLSRIPSLSSVHYAQVWRRSYVLATRDLAADGRTSSYLMVYFTNHREVTIETGCIGSPQLRCWWYDPRTGRSGESFETANTGMFDIEPPTRIPEEDWVLVIDDAAAGYPPPGQAGKE